MTLPARREAVGVRAPADARPPLRIALFHNLGAGGAKRHLYEQARRLKERGHMLHLFCPAGADEVFLPLSGICDSVKVYGSTVDSGSRQPAGTSFVAGTLRRLAQSPLLNPLAERVWRGRMAGSLEGLSRLYAGMAQDIDSGGYNVLYVHHCRLMLAPDLLRFARATPTVFCCHDTPRALVEWPAEPEAGYDAAAPPRGKLRRLGRFVTPDEARFCEIEAQRFEWNTRAGGIVLANSSYSRECLARTTGVNARVCHPGVDTDSFSPDPRVERTRTVLSVGALLPSKRHDFVLRAVATLPADSRPELNVIGYESRVTGGGDGPESLRLQALAADLGVTLTIQREVTEDTLRAAYRAAGVVAFAPLLEPFGLVALEAGACGAAVVGVREGGVRETVVDGETGLLTDPDTVVFGAALGRVLNDRSLAQRLGSAARAAAERDWTWDLSTDRAESILRAAARTAA